jgi:hypothetical protein
MWEFVVGPARPDRRISFLEKLAERASRHRGRRVGVISVSCAPLVAGTTFWHARHPFSALPEMSRALVVLPETQSLADGSVVELKSGTEIAVDFSGDFSGALSGRRMETVGETHATWHGRLTYGLGRSLKSRLWRLSVSVPRNLKEYFWFEYQVSQCGSC